MGRGCWIDESEVLGRVVETHEDDVDLAWPAIPPNEVAPWELLGIFQDKCITDPGWFPGYPLLPVTTPEYDVVNNDVVMLDPNSDEVVMEHIMNEQYYEIWGSETEQDLSSRVYPELRDHPTKLRDSQRYDLRHVAIVGLRHQCCRRGPHSIPMDTGGWTSMEKFFRWLTDHRR